MLRHAATYSHNLRKKRFDQRWKYRADKLEINGFNLRLVDDLKVRDLFQINGSRILLSPFKIDIFLLFLILC